MGICLIVWSRLPQIYFLLIFFFWVLWTLPPKGWWGYTKNPLADQTELWQEPSLSQTSRQPVHQALSPSSALQPGDLPTLHFGEESRVWSLHKGLTEGQNFHRSSCFLPDLSTADFRADIGRRAGSQAAFSAIRLPRFEERQRGSVKHLAPTSSSVQSKLTQSGLLLLPRVPTRSEFHTCHCPRRAPHSFPSGMLCVCL